MTDAAQRLASESRDEGGAGASTYTVDQVAMIAQCSARHVWRLIDKGEVPGVIRLGRLVRFSKSKIDDWLAGR